MSLQPLNVVFWYSLVIDIGNIGYFCSSKYFVESKNDKMETVRENMFLFKFVFVTNNPPEIDKGSRSVQGTGDRR